MFSARCGACGLCGGSSRVFSVFSLFCTLWAAFSLGPLSLCLHCFLFDVTSATRCAEYEDCLVTAVEWTIIAITSDSWEQCDSFYVFHRQRDLGPHGDVLWSPKAGITTASTEPDNA